MSGGSDLIQTAAREAVSGQVTFQLYLADFPGGAVDKNPPASAGGMGSTPGPGTEISRAVEQPGPCATATEPVL